MEYELIQGVYAFVLFYFAILRVNGQVTFSR